ncbi:GNAT family N-acetyltransferase [Qipengyuania flava]|uniref:GNAT family N-acetyltransferase n=1 Tax=Qipengyuania flava TaxID=192812 RepID=UPI00273EC9EB|nr:GNAT family N-acetyltransferase [Qipengyuania flava]
MAKSISLRRVVEPTELASYFPQILSLSKKEANPLGFIPSGGMKTAIFNRRLLALADDATGCLAGYIFFGGVYPSAKVFQIAVEPAFRRLGVGSSLIELLVSHLEQFSYRSLVADIRDDLEGALTFYRSNGFTQVSSHEGGATRGRSILTHVKDLDTDDLFSVYEKRDFLVSQIHGLASRGDAKFSLDINVYFDLAKRRDYATQAEELIRSALAGIVQVAVADEFVRELRKNAKPNRTDPVLNMALCLPKLPRVNRDDLARLQSSLHDLVFAELCEPTQQSWSDCAHLAHAALARSTAFVTRDSTLLKASPIVLREIGLEIVSPQELFALLPSELQDHSERQSGQGFRALQANPPIAREFLEDLGGRNRLYDPISALLSIENSIVRSIEVNHRIEAIGVVSISEELGARPEMAVACRPESPDRRLYVDYLIDSLLRDASRHAPSTVLLQRIPGQSVVNEVARARGFIRSSNDVFEKSAIGRPVYPSNWSSIASDLQTRTGIRLPKQCPLERERNVTIAVRDASKEFSLPVLETLLGPTLIWWTSRQAVIVPIEKQWAEQLLGVRANLPFDFIEDRDASFRSLRGYVSSPRNELKMAAGSLIFFYESKRGGGCGAIVAAAKIISSTVAKKGAVGDEDSAHIVVDDLDNFSSTEEVLLTKFDSVFTMQSHVSLDALRHMGAADGANLVTAKVINSAQSRAILEKGFAK